MSTIQAVSNQEIAAAEAAQRKKRADIQSTVDQHRTVIIETRLQQIAADVELVRHMLVGGKVPRSPSMLDMYFDQLITDLGLAQRAAANALEALNPALASGR